MKQTEIQHFHHCKGTNYFARFQISSPVACENLLTTHFRITNVFFSLAKRIIRDMLILCDL